MSKINKARLLLWAEHIFHEARRASEKHSPFHSHHEAYAVILEEVEEYWREVQKGGSVPRDPAALQLELTQAAAMCLRALYDLCSEQEVTAEVPAQPATPICSGCHFNLASIKTVDGYFLCYNCYNGYIWNRKDI